MAELLFELRSEEIPAGLQARGAAQLCEAVLTGLDGAGLAHGASSSYATPRRLVVVVEDVATAQPDRSEERRGPRVDAPEKAIAGFLNSTGLSLDQCERRTTEKGEFYFARIESRGQPTAALLPALLQEAVAKMAWPKSMRWGSGSFHWIRPLTGVLALFDGTPVALQLDPRVAAGPRTEGHRFLAPGPIAVRDAADYRRKLEAAHVILDAGERVRRIRTASAALAKKEGLALIADERLIEEIAGLVEWPVVLMGRIEEQFLELPVEVLTTAMGAHQRYCALAESAAPGAALAPRFIMVANIEAADGNQAIVAGNERVLRARLADADFFWSQDRKTSLESRLASLDDIVFHDALGSIGERVVRLEKLAAVIAAHVPGAAAVDAARAARLAKADLVTGMVGEFPELQGVMGRYYALEDGETAAVADAIAAHYAPKGPGDACPTAPVSVALALADKIDTLVGFFAIGEKPTGSRDPFALRRAVLGVIRLVLENDLSLPLAAVIREASAAYAATSPDRDWTPPVEELLAFAAERLRVHLRDQGFAHDVVAAAFAGVKDDDLRRLIARAEALSRFLEGEDGGNLLAAYRRAARIVQIEEKKDKTAHDAPPALEIMAEKEEKTLYKVLAETQAPTRAALDEADFEGAMRLLARLRKPLDDFFDKVTVNCEDPSLRVNRLRLLSEIKRRLEAVADFSQIEG